MSIITLFTKQNVSWKFGETAVEFDVVFEDTISAGVEYTQYPVEVGTVATDHGIILPTFYTMTAAVSNNPLSINVTDIAIGALSNVLDSSAFNAFTPFLSSFLAGSNQTRSGSTLSMLFGLMYNREPFDVNAGDIILKNMVITNIERTKTLDNEGGLEFTAELQELITLTTSITTNQPGQSILRDGTPEQTQATSLINKGIKRAKEAGESILAAVGLAL